MFVGSYLGKCLVGKCFALSCFVLAPSLWCAGTTTITRSPLTVLVDFESPHSAASLDSFKQSLSQLLNPGGLQVDVELKQDLPPDAQFGQLVIFRMKGSCSMNPAMRDRQSPPVGPLALAYTSDGQVLHFGEVECDHLRHTLQRVLGVGQSLKNQQAFGTAMAIVVAHEIYHMLGNVTHHTRQGITKPALSADELLDGSLNLSLNAIKMIRKNIHGLDDVLGQ